MNETLIIACPNCNQLNRVPKEKLAEGGKCGSCKSPLILKTPLALNQQSFDKHVLKSDLPILLDFWAPWCGPCKAMSPVLEEAASLLSNRIRVAKVNTEKEPALASKFNIRSIPTLAIFHKGKEIGRSAGAMPLAQLQQWINNTLGTVTN
ncbi:MAG TPA: thioredoxin TrxC [Gammaproteobacteria bacterium]|nr:thioredoxin TrxC [Gammaproteobacteria bacterium]